MGMMIARLRLAERDTRLELNTERDRDLGAVRRGRNADRGAACVASARLRPDAARGDSQYEKEPGE
jgi:hypothetical protein